MIHKMALIFSAVTKSTYIYLLQLVVSVVIFVGCKETKINQAVDQPVFYRLKSGSTQVLDDSLYLDCNGEDVDSTSCFLKYRSSTLTTSLVSLKPLKYKIADVDYHVNRYYHDDKNVHDDEIVVYGFEDEVIAVEVISGADLVNGSRPILMMLYILIENDRLSRSYDFFDNFNMPLDTLLRRDN